MEGGEGEEGRGDVKGVDPPFFFVAETLTYVQHTKKVWYVYII